MSIPFSETECMSNTIINFINHSCQDLKAMIVSKPSKKRGTQMSTTMYLHRSNGSLLCGGNSFLHSTHVSGQSRLVSYCRWDTAQQCRYLYNLCKVWQEIRKPCNLNKFHFNIHATTLMIKREWTNFISSDKKIISSKAEGQIIQNC